MLFEPHSWADMFVLLLILGMRKQRLGEWQSLASDSKSSVLSPDPPRLGWAAGLAPPTPHASLLLGSN